MSDKKEIKSQLSKKIRISGVIQVKSGLHIGGTNVGLEIGGADSAVVRNSLTNEPYIPGSSLKGKMRSLLEKATGKIGGFQGGKINYGPYLGLNDTKDDLHFIPKIFGTTPEQLEKLKIAAQPVTRLIVRDSPLTRTSAAQLRNLKTTDMPFTEVKTEVVIDRITAAAMPRQIERVPAGAEFEFTMMLNIYESDRADELDFLNRVLEALVLVQDDYIGGKGTRGSGEVAFRIDLPLRYKTMEDYQKGNDWQSYPAEGLYFQKELS